MKRLCLFAALAICLLIGFNTTLHAQDSGQGKYVNSASARLVKLINTANGDGYKLANNSFSIGGGWLKQTGTEWVTLYTTVLSKGTDYRLIAAGDMDAKDVDLQILDDRGNVVASDTATSPEAIVNFRPSATARYTVRIRLFASAGNAPCVCLSILMTR